VVAPIKTIFPFSKWGNNRSRAQIFELYPLYDNDIRLALNRALEDDQRGLKSYTPEVQLHLKQQVLRHLVHF
jgi:replication-associated recombination protein RarA